MPEFVLTTESLSHARAMEIAASWGSMITAGDPGAIFYSFPGDARPDWNESQKAAALAWLTRCEQIARDRIPEVEADPDRFPEVEDPHADVADLAALRRYIEGQDGEAFAALDDFTQGFMEAAFFLAPRPGEMGVEDGEHDPGVPEDVGPSDLHPDAWAGMEAICAAFAKEHAADLATLEAAGREAQELGNDFLYTATGSGIRFSDRGYSGEAEAAAERLDAAARYQAEKTLTRDPGGTVYWE